jgi:hypothetical protein
MLPVFFSVSIVMNRYRNKNAGNIPEWAQLCPQVSVTSNTVQKKKIGYIQTQGALLQPDFTILTLARNSGTAVSASSFLLLLLPVTKLGQ